MVEYHEAPTFIVGRKGILFMVRQNGKHIKLGLRINDQNQLQAFDNDLRCWHNIPATLIGTNGQVFSVLIMRSG